MTVPKAATMLQITYFHGFIAQEFVQQKTLSKKAQNAVSYNLPRRLRIRRVRVRIGVGIRVRITLQWRWCTLSRCSTQAHMFPEKPSLRRPQFHSSISWSWLRSGSLGGRICTPIRVLGEHVPFTQQPLLLNSCFKIDSCLVIFSCLGTDSCLDVVSCLVIDWCLDIGSIAEAGRGFFSDWERGK